MQNISQTHTMMIFDLLSIYTAGFVFVCHLVVMIDQNLSLPLPSPSLSFTATIRLCLTAIFALISCTECENDNISEIRTAAPDDTVGKCSGRKL